MVQLFKINKKKKEVSYLGLLTPIVHNVLIPVSLQDPY